MSSRPAVNLEARNFEGNDTMSDLGKEKQQQQQKKTDRAFKPRFQTSCFAFLLTSGMTPLHCAAISHSATVKVLSGSGQLDVALQNKAVDKLTCVQMLLNSGASLLSQVGRPCFPEVEVIEEISRWLVIPSSDQKALNGKNMKMSSGKFAFLWPHAKLFLKKKTKNKTPRHYISWKLCELE